MYLLVGEFSYGPSLSPTTIKLANAACGQHVPLQRTLLTCHQGWGVTELLLILELYLELCFFFSQISIGITESEVTKVPKILTQDLL